MLKFYPIIWKSIAGLADRADREAVYEQSRALLRATQATDPALTPEAIAAQASDLEEAIARAEREREKLVRRQSAPRASAIFARQVLPLEVTPEPLPQEAAAEETVAPALPAEPSQDTIQSASEAPARRTSTSNVRALALAAAALILVVPLASWIYLRGARPTAPAAPKTIAAAQPKSSPESATLYRGGNQFAGAVSWRAEPAVAGDGQGSGFHVDATFEPVDQFPDGLRLALTMAANAAPATTPAAQIAEIRFTGKSGQPADVKAAPGILVRTTPSESGQPLLGVTAKSTVPGLFIVATSPADRDIDANAALLRDSGWIDIPFVDNGGEPAVVSVAVGANRAVIWDALKSWSESAR